LGAIKGRDCYHLTHYDPPSVIGEGADLEPRAPLAGLVGKEGVDVGANVGREVVFCFLDFEVVAYFRHVKGAST
jgi:hypothetical protein